MGETNHVWRLKRYAVGPITDQTLGFEEDVIPEPGEGQFLFRLNYLSLDPTNRGWMGERPTYMPPIPLGNPMRGVVCGTVVQSRHPEFSPGDVVSGIGQWADYQLGTPGPLGKFANTGPVPLLDAFGIFAVVGPTAYFGLLEIGQPTEGETVVVSAAAGATGSIVGQIAKIKGCRVIGIAGTDEKCAWITDDLGFDAAINYKTENVSDSLGRHCPDGIDVYFDCVGGDILDAALLRINLKARIVFCGSISGYNARGPVPGPSNYRNILLKRARVEGFIVLDYMERYPEAISALSQWMVAGKIKYRLDVVDGLENAAVALGKLFTGAHAGKLLVRVADPA